MVRLDSAVDGSSLTSGVKKWVITYTARKLSTGRIPVTHTSMTFATYLVSPAPRSAPLITTEEVWNGWNSARINMMDAVAFTTDCCDTKRETKG